MPLTKYTQEDLNKLKDKWKYIIIHHTLTKDGEVKDWHSIRSYHKDVKGWSDIGYHYGIEKVNGRYEYQLGRDLFHDGAHCKGRNHDGIGICVVGNFDIDSPAPIQYDLTASLCRQLMDVFGIPITNVLPHRKFAPKTCPGKMFWMKPMKTLQDYILEKIT